MKKETVVILGASAKEERYSYMALCLLKKHGHKVLPVSRELKEINGETCYPTLHAVKDQGVKIDTLTLYVNPSISSKMKDEILALAPKRVIFNPGTENQDLYEILEKNNVAYEEACTLVLLNTGQF